MLKISVRNPANDCAQYHDELRHPLLFHVENFLHFCLSALGVSRNLQLYRCSLLNADRRFKTMPTLSPQLIRERLKKYHVTEDQLRKIAETKLRQKSRILEQQKDERFRNWVRPARWPVPDSDDPSTNSKYPSRGKRKSVRIKFRASRNI